MQSEGDVSAIFFLLLLQSCRNVVRHRDTSAGFDRPLSCDA